MLQTTNIHMKSFLLILLTVSFQLTVFSQSPIVLDRVVAIVGDYTVLQSDIEDQYKQYRAQGVTIPDLKCEILRDLLEEKLMLNQAKIDSFEVSEGAVESQLESRMQYFIGMIGSQEELEAYFEKTMLEIKADFRESMRNQMITQQMHQTITQDIKVSPMEVRSFYNRMHKDSIPIINTSVEIQQIVAYPVLSEQAVFEVKERLLDFRRRVSEGESFETLAILYSEDGSASAGGEIGFLTKAELDPEYAKAAFSLKENQISKIVESAFGFHLIQLISRKDDRANTRHILLKPTVSTDARKKAVTKLDSVLTLVRADSLNFSTAAMYFSEDKNTRLSGGKVINPKTNSSLFELDQMDTKDYLVIRDMKVGDISEPYESIDENGKIIYKVVTLKSRIEPHKANLQQDYNLFQAAARNEKEKKLIDKWIREKQEETYIRIDNAVKSCEFLMKGWLVN
jgi:peptidyl-prolyl cis-trans isomerase SurA